MQDFSKFNCPHCGSDNTASMSLVYRRGHATGTAVHTEVVGYDVTTTIHTRSDGSTYTEESRSPCYGNVTRDTYTETDLAKEIAPPEEPKEPEREQTGCFMVGVGIVTGLGVAVEVTRFVANCFAWGHDFETVCYVVLTWCLAFFVFCIMIDPVWDSISGKNRRFAKAMAKYQEEMAEYQEQYAYWQHLYICMRCGHKYYLE